MGRVRSSVPRSRLPLHRRPFADPASLRRWLLVSALALTTAAVTGHVLSGAEAARRRWGETRPVLVVERALQAGDALAGAVAVARWPTSLVPDGAMADLGDLPDGAVTSGSASAGSPVTEAVVARTGVEGDGDRRRVALSAGPARLPLERSDRVDVWATADPSLTGGDLATRRVATGAVVTSAKADSVVVAVEPDEVADVVEAAALATVTLVATT